MTDKTAAEMVEELETAMDGRYRGTGSVADYDAAKATLLQRVRDMELMLWALVVTGWRCTPICTIPPTPWDSDKSTYWIWKKNEYEYSVPRTSSLPELNAALRERLEKEYNA